jgi:murein DD-endopeptidase MepM/ murein hydrolase activator NlpD
MTSLERASRLGLPTTHYFVSVSRGETLRTARITPAGLWMMVSLAPFSLALGLAGGADLALRAGSPLALAAAGAAQAVFAAGGSGEARGQPSDAAAERRREELDAIDDRIRDLAARQARLERRDAFLATLAAEAAKLPAPSENSGALGAIERLAPLNPDAAPGAQADMDGAVRAYAPSGASRAPKAAAPRPFDASQAEPAFTPSLADAALNPDLDPKTRLDLVLRAMDRHDGRERGALEAIDRRAEPVAARDSEILAEAGLDPRRFAAPNPLANAGGPFVPVEAGPEAPAFERAAARVARDVSLAQSLDEAMLFAPLKKPLAGEAAVTSPFGYRADPFLGKLELHTGVDLLQPFGSEIHATGAGRVTHAGPEGGYGDMVEIDHGFGLTTRYGHLSDIAVAEGEVVKRGDVLGRLGSTGRSTGPHLHYEVRIDGEPVDPEHFIRAGAEL